MFVNTFGEGHGIIIPVKPNCNNKKAPICLRKYSIQLQNNDKNDNFMRMAEISLLHSL